MTFNSEGHFKLLKILEDNPEISQRELAERMGLSLGKTNYVLRGLVDKGLLKMGRFYRADNKLSKMMYVLTASGLKHRIELTQSYVQRKRAEYESLQKELEQLELDISVQKKQELKDV